MNISLNPDVAIGYKSPSQQARVITEKWFEENMYCPACPSDYLEPAPPNEKVIDFICPRCDERYQMKSTKRALGYRVTNSAYLPKITAIRKKTNPNYVFMHYDAHSMAVRNLIVVPRHFFSPDIIEKRKPLTSSARRAGWEGSTILLGRLPPDARIHLIMDGIVLPEHMIRATWQHFTFLEEIPASSKGWLTDVLSYVRKLEKPEFTLADVYAFEDELRKLHPKNKHIKPKIRQQLQLLRDKGILEFLERGKYRIVK